jgi:hypothetical protein
VRDQLEALDGDLAELETVWEDGMSAAYAFYRPQAPPPVALAAALVESAVELQRLGGPAPDPPQLLLGDLCLARASRLLAETGDQGLQVGFARAVERVAAAASGGWPEAPLRDLLLAAIAGAP